MRKTLTAIGFARVIVRAVRANFAPEAQEAEIERLAQLFDDMAVSRAMDAELTDLVAEQKQAEIDADILDAVAAELEQAARTARQ